MKNYSRQREAILDVLRSTDTHPTANWIYERVREKIPNISLGTVYRNLSALAQNGDILSINVGDGFEHFDGDIKAHVHLSCKICKNIIDAPLHDDTVSQIARKYKFVPKNAIYIANGICESCIKNQKNNQKIFGGN